jgi:hypothetical protein
MRATPSSMQHCTVLQGVGRPSGCDEQQQQQQQQESRKGPVLLASGGTGRCGFFFWRSPKLRNWEDCRFVACGITVPFWDGLIC